MGCCEGLAHWGRVGSGFLLLDSYLIAHSTYLGTAAGFLARFVRLGSGSSIPLANARVTDRHEDRVMTLRGTAGFAACFLRAMAPAVGVLQCIVVEVERSPRGRCLPGVLRT